MFTWKIRPEIEFLVWQYKTHSDASLFERLKAHYRSQLSYRFKQFWQGPIQPQETKTS